MEFLPQGDGRKSLFDEIVDFRGKTFYVVLTCNHRQCAYNLVCHTLSTVFSKLQSLSYKFLNCTYPSGIKPDLLLSQHLLLSRSAGLPTTPPPNFYYFPWKSYVVSSVFSNDTWYFLSFETQCEVLISQYFSIFATIRLIYFYEYCLPNVLLLKISRLCTGTFTVIKTTCDCS